MYCIPITGFIQRIKSIIWNFTLKEKLLGDKDVELGQAREELLSATQTTQEKDKLLAEARQRCTEQEEKVESLEKTNRSNENVINWLNKQLSSYKSTETAVGKFDFVWI